MIVCALAACSARDNESDHGHDHAEAEPWAVTAWGERYEIFPECEPLVAGQMSKCHTHVTILSDFSPQREGSAAVILRSASGVESVFQKNEPVRDGIYSIEITPEAEGVYDLAFRIASIAGEELVPAGRVRVGSKDHPGGIEEEGETIASGAAPISFLKEQQWRTEFATEWTRTGAVRSSVRGPGRIRPAAGGDAMLSAPLDGSIVTDTRLYVGLDVKRGAAVTSLNPRAAANRSLVEIEGEWTLAHERLERLEKLIAVEAVSQAELDRARARVATLYAELAAARGGSREAPAGKRVPVLAPFEGQIAEVFVIPGQAVSAGDPLARLVRVEPLWVEVALPAESSVLSGPLGGLHLLPVGATEAISIPAERVRLVSRAPSVDAETGTVTVVLEIGGGSEIPPIGSAVQAEIVHGGEREGLVIPASALVDDAGVPVAYVQIEGESFERREIKIVMRQGNSLLVEGLEPGERLVTRGGAAIRRASLISSGVGEGHVH
jgi:RND family efflux transporter MFP subunit